jgi:hypothetical protein
VIFFKQNGNLGLGLGLVLVNVRSSRGISVSF